MGNSMRNIAILGLLAVVVISGSAFTVKEAEKAIVLQLGEIVGSDYKPGLHFKIPLISTVRRYDARIRTADSAPSKFLTSEKKNVIVDFFVKWRINDLGKFYTSTGGGDARRANQLLNDIVRKGLRDEFSLRTNREVISGERAEIMEIMTRNANEEVSTLGIEIVDVRVKRIEYASDVSESVYERMRAERNRVAKDFRARGEEAKERIQADADRQSTILLAEAERDAAKIRGEGDARSAEIYAEAYGEDPEFYRFYRSLEAYRNSLGGESDVMVISPDSEFFRYFKNDK